MVNTMVGASIFGLPALIAARLGRLSPIGFLVAFVVIAVIAACMAEVASQFREAGGPYLYARTAFGPFLAIQNGWLTWLSRIAAVSAVANLFIAYLVEFLPGVRVPMVRAGVLTILIGFLALVNYRGEIRYDPSKPDGMPRKVLDGSRLRAAGWKPSVPLDVGLERTYEWFLNFNQAVKA